MAKPSSVDGIYAAHLFGVNDLINNRFPSGEKQSAVELMLINKLIELCVNRFKWSGLPDSVDTRYLELSLFYTGSCIFFKHPDYGYLALRGAGKGVDMYGNPTSFSISAAPMVYCEVTSEECAPIYANMLRTSELPTVLNYARRLATTDVTIEINTTNARQPRILSADENTRLSLTNIDRQISEGVPVIKVDRKLDPLAQVTALDMGVDADLFDKLGIARTRIFNECMSLLGINNANQDKKERLVASEVSANDEQVGYMRAVNLNARQEAARNISALIGSPVTVEYDPDFSGPVRSTENG